MTWFEGWRPAGGQSAVARLSRPDELVFALVALDQRRVDRSGEGRVIKRQREIFSARFSSRLAPAGAKFDGACGDAEVGSLVIVAVAGLDACLDVQREGLDAAGVGAVFIAGEGANLCHCRIS